MYFTRLAPLKDELAGAGLTERDRYRYAMAWMIAITIFTGLGGGLNGTWKTGTVILDLIITVLGVGYAWRRNGGESGRAFLDRYFSIGWVINFRVILVQLVLALIIALPPVHRITELIDDAGGFASAFTSEDEEPQDAGEGASSAIIMLLFSVYVARATGKHMGQVREATERQGGPHALPPPPSVPGAAAVFAPAAAPVSGMDRFVESVVQRELSQGALSGPRSRRRSTIRPLRSSRRAARKPARKARRKTTRRRR